MQKVTIKSLSFFTGATMLALLCPAGCDDKPTEPPPVKDYVFYFNDGGYYNRYYRYHSTVKKVDSLTIPYASWYGFVVSADGTRLYLSDGAKTVVVSTDSFNVIAEIPYSGLQTVAASSDNKYLVSCV